MVECDLAKVEVAGSNPVSRSSPLGPTQESQLQPFGTGATHMPVILPPAPRVWFFPLPSRLDFSPSKR